MCGTMILEGLT